MPVLPSLGVNKGQIALAPRAWDKAVIGGWTLPGHSKVTSGSIRLKVDHKRKPGSNGANPTFCGLDPQPFDLEVMTYSDNDREQLMTVLDEIRPPSNKDPQPMSFDHPSTRHLGLSSVVIVGMSALVVVSPCVTRLSISMLHWLPTTKKKATNTPSGAPVRKPKNNRTPANPSPTQQPGSCGAPANFTPGH